MTRKITWANAKRKITELKPFPGNPRKADEKQVADLSNSLERFNVADPLVINIDGTVIGGNFRLKLLTEKKIESVDVRIPSRDLTREEANELNLRLNKNQGSWDFGELANFSEGMLKDVGWESEELDEIFQLATAEDDFDPETEYEKIKTPKTKKGELYQLGEHRLLCGDSTKKEDVEKLMVGDKADMVFTDPPYGIDYNYETHNDKNNEENAKLVKDAFDLFNCGKVWTCGLNNLARDIERFGKTKVIVWYKKFAMAGSGLGEASTWEPVLVLNPRIKKLDNNVIETPTDRIEGLRKEHSCPKPVKLFIELIKSFSKRGDIIIDMFGGSGSTLIACEQLNRKCFMMELDPKYCDVIIKRFEAFTGKKATKLEK